MQEYIGKICLELVHGSENDPCTDDTELDEILQIVQTRDEREYSQIIAEKRSERMLYHLSLQRQNIVAGLDINKDQTVLEIGAECGAVTGKLAQMAKHVTCVEVSRKKSEINAYRNQRHDNIDIRVGMLEETLRDSSHHYDIITLIGVLNQDHITQFEGRMIEEILRVVQSYLEPDGKIVIAIENKYGLKYWAGCRDRYSGDFFGSLEAYVNDINIEKLTLHNLRKLEKSTGLVELSCYYPYPDYQYMRCLYSDDYLPVRGELTNNMNNYGTERLFLFNETEVFDSLIADGLFPLFSNAYLIVCGRI
ncbi:MAG: class I SAM-dependent methyltransferase [Bacteroides fragilis]|nr:class I SAM-dependent methyltransferase [Bacteroides fragilis]